MYAVEFQAKIKNGVIEIPSQYRDKFKKVVKVIVLAEPEEQAENMIDQLLEKPLHLTTFMPLARDETHARS